MQLYNCTVRLNGSMLNEVVKTGVTAAEIKVLKAIHNSSEAGVDVVHRIEAAGRVDRSDEEERARLVDEYGEGIANIEHIKSISNILGFEGNPLPKTVPGVDSLPPPKTGRRATRADLPAAPVEDEAPAEEIKEGEFA